MATAEFINQMNAVLKNYGLKENLSNKVFEACWNEMCTLGNLSILEDLEKKNSNPKIFKYTSLAAPMKCNIFSFNSNQFFC